MPTPDREALYETLDKVIAADAEGTWNQNAWVATDSECGTVACFCGWRALLDGGVVQRAGLHGWVTLPDGTNPGNDWMVWGRNRLGLTSTQAADLFDANNSLEDLKRMVDEICGQR